MKETPSAYIVRVMKERGFSFAEVCKRATENGFEISRTSLLEIARGRATNPGVRTVKALAAGLERPESEVAAVFGLHVESIAPPSTVGYVTKRKPRKRRKPKALIQPIPELPPKSPIGYIHPKKKR